MEYLGITLLIIRFCGDFDSYEGDRARSRTITANSSKCNALAPFRNNMIPIELWPMCGKAAAVEGDPVKWTVS